MKKLQAALTWILTLAFFGAILLSNAAMNYKAKKSAIKAANAILEQQKAEQKAEKTITLEVVHDSDPKTTTCPVAISASNSTDLEGDSLYFSWNQISGEDVDLGETANSSEAKFDAEAGEYSFVLSISDTYGATCVDTVFVDIAEEANNCPVPVIIK